jgi:uncharacterized protein (DUF433 family)
VASASIEHIELDEHGVARVSGKRTKVVQIVMDKMAHGWSPEEMAKQYPHLGLAEIHAALAYYYDHKTELDQQIEQGFKESERLRAAASGTPLAQKLRTLSESS